jgi:heterodisulfide reductase subunit B
MKGNKVDKSTENTVEGLADSSIIECPHGTDAFALAGKGVVEPAVAFRESVVEGVAQLEQVVAVALGKSVECVAAVVVAVAVVVVMAVELRKTWSLFHWQ